ncbi:MAG: hypothetical protein M1147_03770 [Nitrospirae bacterium]|nr:hypothetical protein [Nitrospirota bacterium]MCL4456322.1 hypothetical protein [Nitrospirota bacterium]MCL5977234.1 hypothetical protein [Nitrospirota bacterium]
MGKRFAENIIKPEIRRTSELPFHNDLAPGKRRVFLEKRLFSDSDLYAMVRTAKDVTPDQPDYVDAHAHNVSSVYIFLGNNEELEGLKAEVVLDGEVYIVPSPATVFIPKGVMHSYRLIEGSGHFSHIVLKGNYNDSLINPDEISVGFHDDNKKGAIDG